MSSRVLIVGVGGLGSPLALALCQANWVTTLTLLDGDRVELSNLHRQILLREEDLGQAKVDSAWQSLRMLHRPALEITVRAEALRAETAAALIGAHDLVLEGSDCLETKFLVSDTAVALGKPAIIGGIVGFVGQIMTIWPGLACYRCLFEAPPPPDQVVSCQQAGVLGPACGIIAGKMAWEAAALIEQRRQPQAGSITRVDLRTWQSRRLSLKRREDCTACQQAIATSRNP